MIKIEGLSKFFRTEEVETIALNGVSMEVKDGEFVAIMGPSGCGKSTLLNILGLLDNPTSGDYYLADREVGHLKEKERTQVRKGNIGFVFQSFNLIDELNVFENVELPLTYLKVKASERKQMVNDILKRMNISHRANHFPQQLSGGQQQRVALARMMIGEPEVILLDEPFSALDGYLKDIMQRDMQNFLNEYTGDMILVTHSRDEAYKFCGHLTILDSGQALTTGETKKLFERPGILQAARLTGCKNFSTVQKMGKHSIYAVDWDLMLQTKDVVSDDVTHVGIRGHWMKGASEGGENHMEVEVMEYIETTFEHQYLLKNKKGGDCQPVWWMCPKGNFEEDPHAKVPKYIHFPEEHLMLLKEAK